MLSTPSISADDTDEITCSIEASLASKTLVGSMDDDEQACWVVEDSGLRMLVSAFSASDAISQSSSIVRNDD